jgi:hypothetical protein
LLYLIISEPAASRPSEASADRSNFWRWMDGLEAAGEVRCLFPRVGRGMVVVMDLPSHEALSARLNDWCEMVPAQFRVEPLREPDAVRDALRGGS